MRGKFELFMGCLGNGLTICNSAVMENGDFQYIAHISNAGNIKWYVQPEKIPGDALLKIEHEADVMYQKFKQDFEKRPIMKQYQIMLDSFGCDMVKWIKDERPIENKIEDMRMQYYKIA